MAHVRAYANALLTYRPNAPQAMPAAVTAARRAAAMSGDQDPAVLFLLAVALERNRDPESAVGAARKALDILPDGDSVLRTKRDALVDRCRRSDDRPLSRPASHNENVP